MCRPFYKNLATTLLLIIHLLTILIDKDVCLKCTIKLLSTFQQNHLINITSGTLDKNILFLQHLWYNFNFEKKKYLNFVEIFLAAKLKFKCSDAFFIKLI